MSWLKSLKFKRLQNLFQRGSSQSPRRFSLRVRWNQTTKIMAGLVASICSMMALISFFGSLEQSSEENLELSKAESLAPDLGSGDELSLEFGLDAELPLLDSEQDALADTDQPVIQTASVEQAAGSNMSDSGVYHALGRDFGDRQTSGRVEQVAGEHPIYVPQVKQSGNTQPTSGSGAAWLTGEIEDMDQSPAGRAARPLRNY